MKIKVSKYGILAFVLLAFQIVYDFPALITIGKFMIILVLYYFLWMELSLKTNFKVSSNQLSLLFLSYFLVLVVSSVLNLGGIFYSFKELLLGLLVLIIPIGFYLQIVRQISITKRLKVCRDLQKGIFFGALIVLIYVSLTGNYVDYGGLGSRFMGQKISPSMISLNGNLILSYSLINMLEYKKKAFIVPILFSVAMIFLSLSKSGIVLGLLSFIYVAIIKKAYVVISIVIFVIGFLIVTFLPFEAVQSVLFQYVSNDAIGTLSGRSAIWEVCQQLIDVKPFFGYGYNSSVKLLPVFFTNFLVEQAHSVYYESLLNVGIVGTALLGVFVLKVIAKCIKYFSLIRRDAMFAWFLFIVIIGLIRGFTEASFAQANNIIDVFIFFLSLFALDYFLSGKVLYSEGVLGYESNSK